MQKSTGKIEIAFERSFCIVIVSRFFFVLSFSSCATFFLRFPFLCAVFVFSFIFQIIKITLWVELLPCYLIGDKHKMKSVGENCIFLLYFSSGILKLRQCSLFSHKHLFCQSVFRVMQIVKLLMQSQFICPKTKYILLLK